MSSSAPIELEKKNIFDKLQLSGQELSQMGIAWLIFCIAIAPQAILGTIIYGSVDNVALQGTLIALALGPAFILHELGHKFSAQYFRAQAEFKLDQRGLLITVISMAMGFYLLMPGAVFWRSNLSKYSNIRGRVSASGPVVNLILASLSLGLFVFIDAPVGSVGWVLFSFAHISFYLNIFLGLFNLIPVWILDGKKVLEWSEFVWLSFIMMFFLLIVAAKIAFPGFRFNFFIFSI
ncbi:MAG: hypothetical protein ACXAC7_17850 [Candidatus Hodarchaeales archaeon]|jgi:Zn-dependent protease